MTCEYLNGFSILFDGTSSFENKLFLSRCVCSVVPQSITVPVHQRDTLNKVDSTGSFRGYYYVEKRISNSTKFLDLDRDMLMTILRKLLKLLVCYFNIM